MGEAAYVSSKKRLFLKEFELQRFSYTTLKRIMYFFFIFKFPYNVQGFTFWTLLRYLGYALPGLTLLVYIPLRVKRFSGDTALMYLYIAGYALPYIFIAVMYRYSFPISTLTSILTGALLHCAFGANVSGQAGRVRAKTQ